MKTRQLAPRKRDQKPRPRLTERGVILVLIQQGAVIPCALCRLAFTRDDVAHIERDHAQCEHAMHEGDVAAGKWSDIKMHRYVHGRSDPRHTCHKNKTRQDAKIRAKSNRIRGVTKKRKSKPIPGSKASGFKRTFDGKAVRRRVVPMEEGA